MASAALFRKRLKTTMIALVDLVGGEVVFENEEFVDGYGK